MYKNILQGIDNIAIWPVVSFIIFFIFFMCLLWWVFSVDNKFIDKMKQLPMDTNSSNKNLTRNEI
jgi:cytochrome c oxidase cbb3-type subunit IV